MPDATEGEGPVKSLQVFEMSDGRQQGLCVREMRQGGIGGREGI